VSHTREAYYQTETALQGLDLPEAPEGGSRWLRWWRWVHHIAIFCPFIMGSACFAYTNPYTYDRLSNRPCSVKT